MSTHYLDNATLRDLVRSARKSKAVSNELAAALMKLAGGVWDRYHFTEDRDDYIQEAVLHLIGKPLKKAKLTGNLFSYFTTCAFRLGQKLRDKTNTEKRRFDTYARRAAEAGMPIPERRSRPSPEDPLCDS